jgi:hypothetical protein
LSSSVSYAYRVRQEALRREQERRAAEHRLHSAERRYAELRERALAAQQTWGDSVEVPAALALSRATDTAGMVAARSEIDRRAVQAEARLKEHVVDARIAMVTDALARLGGDASEPVSAAEVLADRKRDRARAAATEEARDVQQLIEHHLRRLEGVEADAGASQRIGELAVMVKRARTSNDRDKAVDQLRLTIQKAKEAARQAAARRAELDRLESRLDGCGGPDAGAARAVISSLRSSTNPLPAQLRQQVESAVEADRLAQQPEYVTRQLGKIFEELGYDVGPEFETTLTTNRYARIRQPRWPGYGVQVSVDGDEQLVVNVIRGSAERADQAARDVEVERDFCHRQPELIEALRSVGIDASQARIAEAGSRRLQIVDDWSTGAAQVEQAPSRSQREAGR